MDDSGDEAARLGRRTSARDPKTRLDALQRLGELGLPAARQVGRLVEAVEDNDEVIRYAATRGLWALHRAGVTTVFEALRSSIEAGKRPRSAYALERLELWRQCSP